MARVLAMLVSAHFMLHALSVWADDALPRVAFPSGQTLPMNAAGHVTVRTALLQVELLPGLILSAPRGTQFSLAATNGEFGASGLTVLRGTLTALDLQSNAIMQLPPGRYLLASSPGATTAISAAPDATTLASGARDAQPATDTLTPGYRLSDAVMTQQQKYLDSLKVDVRDINNILASIIRGLVPRR